MKRAKNKGKSTSKLDSVPKKGHDQSEKKSKPLSVSIYNPARSEILTWSDDIKRDLGAILTKLQNNETVGMPDVKSMKTVGSGCYEIRLKDSDGIYRAFYIKKMDVGILVFHGFKKKTQKTPQIEIDTGKTRLKEFLKEFNNEK